MNSNTNFWHLRWSFKNSFCDKVLPAVAILQWHYFMTFLTKVVMYFWSDFRSSSSLFFCFLSMLALVQFSGRMLLASKMDFDINQEESWSNLLLFSCFCKNSVWYNAANSKFYFKRKMLVVLYIVIVKCLKV